MQELAVLTGDIVGSQKLEPGGLDQAFAALEAVSKRLEASTSQDPHLTRIRGDSWQAVTPAPFALRAAFLYRAAVRSCGRAFETRLGLGIGPGDIRGQTLEDADGPAFVESGHALDTIRKSRRIVGSNLSYALTIALPLADRLSAGWTPRQAEIATHALSLPQPTHEDVADLLRISRQSVQRQWAVAHLEAIADSCLAAEVTSPKKQLI